MKRSLILNREVLAELSADELVSVVGGDAAESHIPTCPVRDCANNVTYRLTCYCTLVC